MNSLLMLCCVYT